MDMEVSKMSTLTHNEVGSVHLKNANRLLILNFLHNLFILRDADVFILYNASHRADVIDHHLNI